MEIMSQRLDFLTLTIHITKAQNILEHIREGRKKKKKTRRTQAVVRDLGRARCLGSARPEPRTTPGSRATQALRAAQVARRPGPRDATAKEFWRFCFLSFAFF